MRNKLLVANWKMNKDWQEAISLLDDLESELKENKNHSNINIIIAPSFPYLKYASTKKEFSISAQNCHSEKPGSYTGEISVEMLKSINTEYIILGHSERRKYFQETDAIISKKINITLNHNLKPILCCGENWDLREKNQHIDYVNQQITNSLKNIEDNIKNISIAYEPIWAIGTNKIPKPEDIEIMHNSIRKNIENLFGTDISNTIPILYGGNLNNTNAKEIFKCENVDGGLVGRASLSSKSFLEILDCF